MPHFGFWHILPLGCSLLLSSLACSTSPILSRCSVNTGEEEEDTAPQLSGVLFNHEASEAGTEFHHASRLMPWLGCVPGVPREPWPDPASPGNVQFVLKVLTHSLLEETLIFIQQQQEEETGSGEGLGGCTWRKARPESQVRASLSGPLSHPPPGPSVALLSCMTELVSPAITYSIHLPHHSKISLFHPSTQ